MNPFHSSYSTDGAVISVCLRAASLKENHPTADCNYISIICLTCMYIALTSSSNKWPTDSTPPVYYHSSPSGTVITKIDNAALGNIDVCPQRGMTNITSLLQEQCLPGMNSCIPDFRTVFDMCPFIVKWMDAAWKCAPPSISSQGQCSVFK